MDFADAFSSSSREDYCSVGCEDAEEDSLPPLFRSLATEERKLSDLVFGWLYRAAPGGGGPGALSRAEEEEETGRKYAGEERDLEEVAVAKEKEPRTFGAWGVNREALFLFPSGGPYYSAFHF